ncbi:hypothetical protein NPIL_280761 [Nephila pilipes]|uniref:Uncharacterized protein n=1 Tax=Nephila pilipes TaxID=299642 RepID=A0A8X6IIP6_NEPPI|nr:hypothetical protein NPIL_280761 [Nephila pilipes]
MAPLLLGYARPMDIQQIGNEVRFAPSIVCITHHHQQRGKNKRNEDTNHTSLDRIRIIAFLQSLFHGRSRSIFNVSLNPDRTKSPSREELSKMFELSLPARSKKITKKVPLVARIYKGYGTAGYHPTTTHYNQQHQCLRGCSIPQWGSVSAAAPSPIMLPPLGSCHCLMSQPHPLLAAHRPRCQNSDIRGVSGNVNPPRHQPEFKLLVFKADRIHERGSLPLLFFRESPSFFIFGFR